MTMGRRFRDLMIYVLVGIAVVIAILWGAVHSSRSGAEVIGKWGGLRRKVP